MRRNLGGTVELIELDRWENEGGTCCISSRFSAETLRIQLRSRQTTLETADQEEKAQASKLPTKLTQLNVPLSTMNPIVKNQRPQFFGTRFAMGMQ